MKSSKSGMKTEFKRNQSQVKAMKEADGVNESDAAVKVKVSRKRKNEDRDSTKREIDLLQN